MDEVLDLLTEAIESPQSPTLDSLQMLCLWQAEHLKPAVADVRSLAGQMESDESCCGQGRVLQHPHQGIHPAGQL